MTGGRVKRARSYVGDEPFMLTYGDGVADIDLDKLVKSHQASNKIVTMTAVMPSGRFGAINIDHDNNISSFLEKPQGDGAWINGGFFVCQPELFDYITEGDATVLEKTPFETLARSGKLHAYKHQGFWQPMDTLKDKNMLTDLWTAERAPWAKWVQNR